jgi:hypothetical protein
MITKMEIIKTMILGLSIVWSFKKLKKKKKWNEIERIVKL